MARPKKNIIFENRLEEVFSYLPQMKYNATSVGLFDVTFGYGDKKALNAFLKMKGKGNVSPYPLIWLLYPYKEIHTRTEMKAENVNLVLAVNTNAQMQNKERIEETFKNVLFPLLDNVTHCITSANIFNISEEIKIVKHPNYSDTEDGELHAGTFIWDAIRVEFDVTVIDGCLRKIIF